MRVRCACFVEVTEEEDLPALDWDALPQPVLVMGGGSNLLFTQDFPGTVLHVAAGITAFGGTPFASFSPAPPTAKAAGPSPYPCAGVHMSSEECFVTLPAGTVFDDFCAWAAAEGLWGPENLSFIPGEVGASAVQNIGAYGVEAKDIIESIRAYDRETAEFVQINPADCAYGYRTSRFKTEWKGRYIITAVTYRLSRTPQPRLDYGGIRKALKASGKAVPSENCRRPRHMSGRAPSEMGGTWFSEDAAFPLSPMDIREVVIGIRRQKLPDPAELGSAGSFFCNPVIPEEHFRRIVARAREENGPDCEVPHYETPQGVKVPAAWLIDQCGLKGAANGGAQVYPHQPLVIVNRSGRATPEEIIGLEQRIVAAVAAKYNIVLHPEVEHV